MLRRYECKYCGCNNTEMRLHENGEVSCKDIDACNHRIRKAKYGTAQAMYNELVNNSTRLVIEDKIILTTVINLLNENKVDFILQHHNRLHVIIKIGVDEL